MIRLLLAAAVACALAGCGLPVAWAPVVSAGLGFGTAVVTLDAQVLKVWNDRHPPEEDVSPGP